MKAILFGATGMVGQGVLRECLLDPQVTSLLTVGRSITGQHHSKLIEVATPDLFDLSNLEERLTGFDVCFFCLGVSSAGMAEAEYTRTTYDLTLSIARTLLRLNPSLRFLYVSGMSTDSSEHGRSMWARVKGRTENALFALGFPAAYMLRPAGIVPLHGIRSKTPIYRVVYTLLNPILPWLRTTFPKYLTTTEELGRTMITLAASNQPGRIVENAEITRALPGPPPILPAADSAQTKD
jgi:uncharacterized protein YbjT (DUF2867 family)